jgi:two-component system OmpR family response regulator
MESNGTILVVEDQPGVRVCLEQILRMAGYQVLAAGDGREALATLEAHDVDLIVADIMMPNMNGYQLFERVVDKPVEAQDLLAVVRGKLRRAQHVMQMAGPTQRQPPSQSDLAPEILSLGRLELEVGEYRVWLDQESVELSNTEFLLLEHLALQANKVVPLSELIKTTHGLEAGYREASDLLRPLVRSIRRKMGYDAGDLGFIESVRGVGYRLVPPNDV